MRVQEAKFRAATQIMGTVRISHVASYLSNTTTTTTAFNLTLGPTSVNDIVCLEYVHRGTIAGSLTGNAGTIAEWTQKHSQIFGTLSPYCGYTYWRRATENLDGRVITVNGLINSCAAVANIYRDAVATGDPLADATVVGEANAEGDETQAEIVTASNNAMVVLCVANSPDLNVSSGACTSPGALVERAERLSTGGTDVSISHWSELKPTAGGTGAFTWAQTNATSGSWAYAIKPK